MAAASSMIIFFSFSLIFFNLLRVSISMENCTTPSCNSSASFSVSFPFRLPQYQSNVRCGYSSDFTLSCSTNDKNSLLHLPNMSSFAIDTIDYWGQMVTVTDPNRCFPQRFLDLDLSTSPFSFLVPTTYTYFNCSQTVVGGLDLLSASKQVTCMSDEDYSVIVQFYDYPDPTVMDNCTVVKSSFSAPIELYSYPDQSDMSVALQWSEPQCGNCAIIGQVCGFQDGSNTVECLENDTQAGSSSGDDNPESEPKSKSKSKKKSGLALGLGIPGGVLTMIAAAVAAYMFASKRRGKGKLQQSNPHPEPHVTQTETNDNGVISGPE